MRSQDSRDIRVSLLMEQVRVALGVSSSSQRSLPLATPAHPLRTAGAEEFVAGSAVRKGYPREMDDVLRETLHK